MFTAPSHHSQSISRPEKRVNVFIYHFSNYIQVSYVNFAQKTAKSSISRYRATFQPLIPLPEWLLQPPDMASAAYLGLIGSKRRPSKQPRMVFTSFQEYHGSLSSKFHDVISSKIRIHLLTWYIKPMFGMLFQTSDTTQRSRPQASRREQEPCSPFPCRLHQVCYYVYHTWWERPINGL